MQIATVSTQANAPVTVSLALPSLNSRLLMTGGLACA
jgi:hypothetical protein